MPPRTNTPGGNNSPSANRAHPDTGSTCTLNRARARRARSGVARSNVNRDISTTASVNDARRRSGSPAGSSAGVSAETPPSSPAHRCSSSAWTCAKAAVTNAPCSAGNTIVIR